MISGRPSHECLAGLGKQPVYYKKAARTKTVSTTKQKSH